MAFLFSECTSEV